MRLVLILLWLLLPLSSHASVPMRPYSGIGVLTLSTLGPAEPIPLYHDPGISRCCMFPLTDLGRLNTWLFGSDPPPHLLVTTRRGDWLEVEYDDAGRTAWLKPERRWNYTPWEQFLKGRMVQFLRNSPKKQQQVVPRPGTAEGTPLTSNRLMKVILAQGDWVYVLLDQNSAGWIRWRDSDGRLLVGFDVGVRK